MQIPHKPRLVLPHTIVLILIVKTHQCGTKHHVDAVVQLTQFVTVGYLN